MNKKYIVRLTAEERAHLHQMLSAEHISEALEVSTTTIGRVRQKFVEHSLTAALERRLPCGHHPRRLDGEAEVHLIALACSPAPAGHVHWTIRLLADRLVEVGYVARGQIGATEVVTLGGNSCNETH